MAHLPSQRLIAIALALTTLLGAAAACGQPDGGPDTGPPPSAAAAASPSRWVYWLQGPDLPTLAQDDRTLVIDYSHDGTGPAAFTRAEIDTLHAGPNAARVVLAYMSIGEAEDYRFYWEAVWGEEPPPWLDDENPNWPGNFKVRYWEPDWQRVIFGSPDSYLDRILAAGFDGVYLDIIDAYAYFEERGRESAEQEMTAFVRAIAAYARGVNPEFLVVPQNAIELGRHQEYLAAVDGFAQEGLYYGYDAEDEATSPDVTTELEEFLDEYVEAGKLVLVVDYASSPDKVRDAYRRATERGYTSTVTTVDLDRLPFPE